MPKPPVALCGATAAIAVTTAFSSRSTARVFAAREPSLVLDPARLDGIEIGRVGQQAEQLGSRVLDQLPHGGCLCADRLSITTT